MANEPSTGADRNGFNPFPSPTYRYPGPEGFVGPLSAWRPYQTEVDAAYQYASQWMFSHGGDRSLLRALASVGIGSVV